MDDATPRSRVGNADQAGGVVSRGKVLFGTLNIQGFKRLIAWLQTPRYTDTRRVLGFVWPQSSERRSRDRRQRGEASREEVGAFVGKLRVFHGSLDETERAMLGTILEGAQRDDTGGHVVRIKRYGDLEEGGSSESQGDEDNQGFALRVK